jgi:hypothetical protein
MIKKIKITEAQFKKIVESTTHDEIEETHLESEPFTEYSDEKQEDLAHGEEHDTKNYKNPHLSEQIDDEDEDEDINPLSQVGTFPENEFGEITLEDSDIDELFDYKDGTRRRFTGVIYYDALIPMTDDEEYDKKIAMGILENERKKMMNGETYLSQDESVFFRDKLY